MIERRKTNREIDDAFKRWNDAHWAAKRANAARDMPQGELCNARDD